MRTWGYRVLRAAFMAILAGVLYETLDRHGQVSWFLPFVGAVFLLWFAEQARRVWVRRKKEADWDRWEAAIFEPGERGNAIMEVQRALARSKRFGARLRQEQAHLSVVLAELLDASNRAPEGIRVLAKIDLDALPPSQAVVVRHAKIVLYLTAELLDEAESVLATRAKESGAPDMDARLDLLGAMIALERGHPERALEVADAVEKHLPDDESLRDELCVLRAAGLDAKGERDRALEILRTLDEGVLDALAKLGPGRVRPLATAAQQS
jgi:hypothetical protein